jgi:pyrophosphatase PpaX
MDGTLIDTNDLVIGTLQRTVEKFLGYWPELDTFHEVLGKPLAVQLAFFDKEKAALMVADYRREYRRHQEERTRLYPGVLDTLKGLKEKGIRMAVQSNKGRGGIEHAVAAFDLKGYFDQIIAYEDVVEAKPSPEGIKRILKAWDISEERVLFVGDSHNDILAANLAGVRSALVDWSLLPEDQFKGLKIDLKLKNLAELLKIC